MDIKRVSDDAIELTINKRPIFIGQKRQDKADIQLIIDSKHDSRAMEPGVFFEPGEYEIQGIMIDGVNSGLDYVSYHIVCDGLTIAVVALDKTTDLTDEILGHLQPAQILVLWVKDAKPTEVAELMSRVEATAVIPVFLPFSSAELEGVVKMAHETVAQLKLNAKDLTPELPKLYTLS